MPNRTPLVASPDTTLRGFLSEIPEVPCAEAEDLSELLDAVQDLDPAVVILDPRLSEGPVEDVLRALRAVAPRVPVLLLWPAEREFDVARLEELGVRETLPMPLHAGFVRDRLARALRHEPACGSEDCLTVPSGTFRRRVEDALEAVRGSGRHVALLGLSLPEGRKPDLGAFERTLLGALEGGSETQALEVRPSDLSATALEDGSVRVLMSGLERIQDVARCAARLRDVLGRELGDAGGCAIGVAVAGVDASDTHGLLECVQQASHRARSEGPSVIAYHNEAQGRWALERLTLEQSLRDAVAEGQLRVYYQPRCAIESRQALGFEALVRWIHPQLGTISPAQFIPLAEETGLIVSIGEWVLREACRQNAAWREAGFAPVRVSVNLSPVQFRDPELVETVRRALDDTGLPASGLELEVTESMLMNDPRSTARTLGRLQEMGIHISIDDFGTGYSSLSYLKQFPIDALKIDQSFVRNVTTDADDAAIATAIILMGHSLKLKVVAEGVETESQLAFLKVLQCNEIQGYLISPPVPAPSVERFLLPATGARAA